MNIVFKHAASNNNPNDNRFYHFWYNFTPTFLKLKVQIIIIFLISVRTLFIYGWYLEKCHPVQCVLDEVLPLDRFIGLLICSSKLSYPHLHLRILLFRLRWENTFLKKRNWHKIVFCCRIYQHYTKFHSRKKFTWKSFKSIQWDHWSVASTI